MSSLAEDLAADRRRVMLDLLLRDAGYRLADDMLRVGLKHMGRGTHRVDIIRTEMSWLEEQGLVRVIRVPRGDGSDDWHAVLTREGGVVAEGALHPGVARRDPS